MAATAAANASAPEGACADSTSGVSGPSPRMPPSKPSPMLLLDAISFFYPVPAYPVVPRSRRNPSSGSASSSGTDQLAHATIESISTPTATASTAPCRLLSCSRVTKGLHWLAQVLALVHGEPGHAAVGIRHHPGAGNQRPIDDGLAPLEGAYVACRHDGHPHQQEEQAHLQRRERGCQPCIHSDEH